MMPHREELLIRDEKTGITKPKEEWKRQRFRTCGRALREMQYSAVTVFTGIIFIGVFFVTI